MFAYIIELHWALAPTNKCSSSSASSRVRACVCVCVCIKLFKYITVIAHTHTLLSFGRIDARTNSNGGLSHTHCRHYNRTVFSKGLPYTSVCTHTHTRTRAAPGRRCVHTISIAARATNALHKCVLRASMRFVPYAFDTTVSSTYVRPDRPDRPHQPRQHEA